MDDYIEYLLAWQISGFDECWFTEAEYEIACKYNQVDYIDIHTLDNKIFIEIETYQCWVGDPTVDGELMDFESPKRIYVQCNEYMDIEEYFVLNKYICFEEFALLHSC